MRRIGLAIAISLLAGLALPAAAAAGCSASSAEDWSQCGDRAFDKGDYPAAVTAYEEALRLVQHDYEVRYNIAQVELELKNYDAVIRHIGIFMEDRPDVALAFDLRGLAFMGKRDYDAALQDFSEAVRLKPQSYGFLYDRGTAHHAAGAYETAIADYSAVIAIEPEFADAFYQRGRAYRKLGDEARAKEDLAAAKRLDPTVATRLGELL
ncbi:tetratricopeptide repeat protein [Hypericibacter sp.]|uniref:tetratricopeptide repeat protein n=1 Tax=Hypericibacter sp. TaxID=2705401 RepID=UPI003D6D95D5